MAKNRKRGKTKMQRRKNAAEAVDHLSSVILDNSYPMIVRQNAAIHLRKTSTHNKIQINPSISHIICKRCMILMIPGTTSRVRIRDGQKVTTCLKCGFIRRFGGGPKYHRRD